MFVDRTFVDRQSLDREFSNREFIDREFIERQIYYRFGEYIDGVYIINLQTQEYIDAHIQIDSQYDFNIGKFLGNISIGTGVIIITAITIPALVPALGPQIAVIVTHIVQASIASSAIDAAINGAITYAKTGGDTRATVNQALMGASTGFKWGAIFASGAEVSSVLIRSAMAIRIATINSGYVGKVHPDSGIRFVEKTILKDGKLVKGVFPEFSSDFNTRLPQNLLQARDRYQFRQCMDDLLKAINKDPKLASKFTAQQLEEIRDGFSLYPSGYTWHHNEETGLMQLVDFQKHNQARHTGGKAIWGGGAAYR